MKKIYLLVSLIVLGTITSQAQISITSADMPSPVTMYVTAVDTTPSVTIGNYDSMQVWDFTMVGNHYLDTSIALNYNDYPNTAFSAANMVMLQKGSQDFYGYTVNMPNNFKLIGGSGTFNIQGNLTPVNQTTLPSETIFNFPTSYDSSFNETYVEDAKFYFGQQVSGITVDSVHRRSTVQKYVHADAYGTMTTPFGGPYDVIRIEEIKVNYDTIKAYFFGDWNLFPGGTTSGYTTTYYWWANGLGTALATARIANDSTVESIEWLYQQPRIPPVQASATSVNTTCHTLCDGSATVIPEYGVAPFTYSWNTIPAQDSTTATNLCPGTYTVIVIDSVQDTASVIVTVGMPTTPVISANGVLLSTTGSGSYQWLLNDSIINGATNMTYTVTQNGAYAVIVTNNSCADTSAIYNFNSIGVNELNSNNKIYLYPNPANNNLTILVESELAKEATQLEIRNELGQLVEFTMLQANTSKIVLDINAYPQGAYFVTIKNAGTITHKKFIKH